MFAIWAITVIGRVSYIFKVGLLKRHGQGQGFKFHKICKIVSECDSMNYKPTNIKCTKDYELI